MYSLLIRGGLVIDPETGTEERKDIAVCGDKIVKAETEISGSAVSEIDAGDCIVTPGLIDHHTHIYPMAKIGIPGEAVCFASGVTTAVDAGSTGCDTYEKHRPWMQGAKLGIRAYLNVCSTGLDSLPDHMEDVAPAHMNREGIKRIFDRYGSELLGLKLRTSRAIVGEQGLEPLKMAVRMGEELGVPLMVHITDPPKPLEEITRLLRPRDIVTHMYQNTGYSILADGQVSPEIREARGRGILFEAADARAHFSFEVSEKAIEEEFLPDFIGTDITRLSMHLRPTSFNLAMQISKYCNLGIPFVEVIRRCTWNPAVEMGMADRIGSIREGKQADLAVFKVRQKKNLFGDRPSGNPECVCREGSVIYEPVLTVKNGEMVYRSVMF